MGRHQSVLLLLGAVLCAAAPMARAQAHPASIVVRVESAETNPAKPVAGARVSLYSLGSGQSIREAQNPTGARGEATLDVSPSVTQTGAVRLEVINSQNLVILEPADGQFTALPPMVRLTLVHKGSQLLFGPANVQAMLKRLSLQVTSLQKQQTAAAQQRKPDLEAALNAWAAENGLAAADVDQHVKQWAEDIQKQKAQATRDQQYLAEMALRHFDQAAAIADAETDSGLAALDELQKQQAEQSRAALAQVLEKTQQTVSALQLAYHFHEATSRIEKTVASMAPTCTQYASSAAVQSICLNATLSLADSYVKEGDSGDASSSLNLLAKGVARYRRAAQDATDPRELAGVQVRLGNVLWDEGERATGEQAMALLAQAVDAYHHALEVRTKESLPQDWAKTMRNLALAQDDLGNHAAAEASRLAANEVDPR